MKTTKKPNGKANAGLCAVAAAAEKRVEAARKHARLVKALFKEARKALKQAKKAAKAARKRLAKAPKKLRQEKGKVNSKPAPKKQPATGPKTQRPRVGRHSAPLGAGIAAQPPIIPAA
jgi:hypothetical protein